MRVTTAFNRLLGIDGAQVTSIVFAPEGVVVGLRLRRRRLLCPCGRSSAATYDRSTRRWRHLDLGSSRLFLEAEIRRVHCRDCDQVRTEEVPWARARSRHTRDFEDVLAFMAQRMDKTTVTKLLRVGWKTVADVVQRVVADHLRGRVLDGLAHIGVDEVSYRKGYRFLTVVADHDRNGAVVWAGEGRSHATLEAFFDELGPQGCARLQAVSLDLGAAYEKATTNKAPAAQQCVDPFHVVKLANEAVDKVRRGLWQQERLAAEKIRNARAVGRKPRGGQAPSRARYVKHTRWALVKDPGALNDNQWAVLDALRRQRSALYRAWQLKEGLRDLYRLAHRHEARSHLAWWLAWACRSRIPAFVTFAKTVRANHDRILAAVELGLSNSKLEGINSKIRLINHRGYGHHSAAAVIAMIYLCCGGITIKLPTET